MAERTLVIVKPDGVRKRLIGEVIRRFEVEGLKVVAMKMLRLSKAEAEGFYAVHRGKPFFEGLTTFMSQGPVVAMVLEGEGAIERVRTIMGATDPKEAAEGTIRRLYADNVQENIVHGSDSPESAAFEIPYFFSSIEIMEY
ncbi:MAG: nucleoside-diphosphate kinase [Deltaproteobacteria bacterium]|nr:MAG: nucleoside-diphosphate kinase [Deltaproteobacteria bacterium]RLA96556.1 MAG: nucleoside-diphosphate kinase [Deltaproteobacteria bacterium]